MKPRYLFFDLDGTLVDSGEGIMKCARHALKHFGIEEDFINLRKFVGPPLEDAFSEFYGFDEVQTAEAVKVFRERYFRKGINEQTLYPKVIEFLQELKRRGYILAVTTSKMQIQADKVVSEIFPQLSGELDHVFARDAEGKIHTKAEVIAEALRYYNIQNPDIAIMIGDRKYDIKGAAAHGLRSIGVEYGYGSKEEFEAAGATYMVDSYDAILSLLDNL